MPLAAGNSGRNNGRNNAVDHRGALGTVSGNFVIRTLGRALSHRQAGLSRAWQLNCLRDGHQ